MVNAGRPSRRMTASAAVARSISVRERGLGMALTEYSVRSKLVGVQDTPTRRGREVDMSDNDDTKKRRGDLLAARELVTITEVPVAIPDARQLVHLQFRRFAGCPICNL